MSGRTIRDVVPFLFHARARFNAAQDFPAVEIVGRTMGTLVNPFATTQNGIDSTNKSLDILLDAPVYYI